MTATSSTPPDRLGTLELALIAVGGAVGALLRWGLVESPLFTPKGSILACNLIGSAGLGAIVTSRSLSDRRRRVLGTGLCGGLTTLSTIAVNAGYAILEGDWADGVVSAGSNLALTLGAATLGALAVNRRATSARRFTP